MTIKELREAAGMSRKEFAEYFGISYRRVQNWELDARNCSDLLLGLMEYKLVNENIISTKEGQVKVICYGIEKIWTKRKDAVEFYAEAAAMCEGSERERYFGILQQLEDGCPVCIDTTDL